MKQYFNRWINSRHVDPKHLLGIRQFRHINFEQAMRQTESMIRKHCLLRSIMVFARTSTDALNARVHKF